MEDPKGTVGAPQSWDYNGAAVATKPAHALSLAMEGSGLWGGRELRATAPVCPRQTALACGPGGQSHSLCVWSMEVSENKEEWVRGVVQPAGWCREFWGP